MAETARHFSLPYRVCVYACARGCVRVYVDPAIKRGSKFNGRGQHPGFQLDTRLNGGKRRWRQFPRSLGEQGQRTSGTDRHQDLSTPTPPVGIAGASVSSCSPNAGRAIRRNQFRRNWARVYGNAADTEPNRLHGPPLTDNSPFVTLAASFSIFLPPILLLLRRCRLRRLPLDRR